VFEGVCTIVASGRGNDCGGYFHTASVLHILHSTKLHVTHDLKRAIAKGDSFFRIVTKKARCGGYRQHPNNQYGYDKFY
jgi:hypothetical protein